MFFYQCWKVWFLLNGRGSCFEGKGLDLLHLYTVVHAGMVFGLARLKLCHAFVSSCHVCWFSKGIYLLSVVTGGFLGIFIFQDTHALDIKKNKNYIFFFFFDKWPKCYKPTSLMGKNMDATKVIMYTERKYKRNM